MDVLPGRATAVFLNRWQYERWSLRDELNKPRALFTDLLAIFLKKMVEAFFLPAYWQFFSLKEDFCSSHRPGQFQR
jgi:hypothetical protein